MQTDFFFYLKHPIRVAENEFRFCPIFKIWSFPNSGLKYEVIKLDNRNQQWLPQLTEWIKFKNLRS